VSGWKAEQLAKDIVLRHVLARAAEGERLEHIKIDLDRLHWGGFGQLRAALR